MWPAIIVSVEWYNRTSNLHCDNSKEVRGCLHPLSYCNQLTCTKTGLPVRTSAPKADSIATIAARPLMISGSKPLKLNAPGTGCKSIFRHDNVKG